MKKEYVISIPPKQAQEVSQIILGVMDGVGEKKVSQLPEKFQNAMLGLACRFYVKGRKRPAYKMNEDHIIGLLDVIGGFYCAASRAKDLKLEDAPYMYRIALKLMRLASKIEAQASKQGFVPLKEEAPTPKKPTLTLVH